MKLLPLNVYTKFAKFDLKKVIKVMDECNSLIKNYKSLLELLQPYEAYEGVEPSKVDSQRLDFIEEFAMDYSYGALQDFSNWMCAWTQTLNRRTRYAVHYIQLGEKVLNSISEVILPPTAKQVAQLKEIADNVIADLSYFLYYQFQLDHTKKTIADGSEVEINLAVHTYLDETGIQLPSYIMYLEETMKKHRPNFQVFEEYPELEEEFHAIAGMYARDFDLLSEVVTHELVYKIISGTVDVEATIKSLEEELHKSLVVEGE